MSYAGESHRNLSSEMKGSVKHMLYSILIVTTVSEQIVCDFSVSDNFAFGLSKPQYVLLLINKIKA